MASVSRDTTIREYQDFVRHVYGKPNDMHFDLFDMVSNVQRFAMRGLKGIRMGDREKTRKNLLISLSWFISTMNRLHIDIEDAVWNRYPYLCSYCASCPCSCGKDKPEERMNVPVDGSKRPAKLKDFQAMFQMIYPADKRTLNKAGVHMAEEVGEFSEALLAYRGDHRREYFENVILEAADLFSHYLCVFNSLGFDIAGELAGMFRENCHECGKAPCECDFNFVVDYRS